MLRTRYPNQGGATPPVTSAALAQIHLARNVEPRVVSAQVQSGAWTRVRRGAYVETAHLLAEPAANRGSPARTLESFQARRRFALAHIAAVAAQKHKDLTFSHESAALLQGLPLWRIPRRTHLTVRTYASTRHSRDVFHHMGHIDAEDAVLLAGLPATSLERTVFDCACTMPPVDALVIADAAVRLGADVDRLDQLIRDKPGQRGIRSARLISGLAEPGAESPWETATRLTVIALGLPRPQLQRPVQTRLGIFYLDMGWQEWKVAIEFDGRVKYTELADGNPGDVFFKEKRRQDAIEEEGWRFIRVTRADLRSPDELLARLARVLPQQVLAARTPLPGLFWQ